MPIEETMRSVSYALVRFSAFASNALVFGFVPVILFVLRPAFSQLPGTGAWQAGRVRLAARLEGLLQAALVGSVVATALALLLQALLTSEFFGGDLGTTTFTSVLETSFGQWYALRFPLVVALAILLIGRVRAWSLAGAGDDRNAPSRLWWGAWAALGVTLLATSSFSGHAAVASPRALALINDVLHLCAGATWFAGIVVFAVALPDGWRGQTELERLKLLAPVVNRFSQLAIVSIGLVAVTGTVASFLHLEAAGDLIHSDYGKLIALKIGVFLLIVGLGAINRYFLQERLNRSLDEGRSTGAHSLFRKTIAAELAVALAVFGLTGVLVGQARTKGGTSASSSVSQTLPDSRTIQPPSVPRPAARATAINKA